MAQEFGGKFSPGAPAPVTAAKTDRPKATKPKAGFRAWLLMMAPLPLLFSGFGNIIKADPAGIIRDFAAFTILVLAAWLLREGLKAEAAFHDRKSARKPAFPRKVFASVLTGLSVGLALTGGTGSILVPITLGLLAAGLHSVAFGLDPLKNKGGASIDAFSDRRVAMAVDEAEGHITTMLNTLAPLKDRALQTNLNAFVATAREMFRTVENDPRDLSAARKYLSVYLMGAKDATIKFADLYQKNRDPIARAAYEGLLSDLDTTFKSRRQELLLDDRSDLDVEIDVLRDRLRREGVQTQ